MIFHMLSLLALESIELDVSILPSLLETSTASQQGSGGTVYILGIGY
jgi:hypothetical protein